jgi:hypothetical protein
MTVGPHRACMVISSGVGGTKRPPLSPQNRLQMLHGKSFLQPCWEGLGGRLFQRVLEQEHLCYVTSTVSGVECRLAEKKHLCR